MTNGNGFYSFLLGTLSVWRIAHLLHAEDAPWESVVWLRRLAGDGFWGQLLDRFYCLSVWIAAPFALLLGRKPGEQLLLWTALSAGAILTNSVLGGEYGEQPALYFEDSEDRDGMLR